MIDTYMTSQEITKLIKTHIKCTKLIITHDKNNRHFKIKITAVAFKSINIIEQHKLIMNILNPYLNNQEESIHAIEIKTFSI